MSPSPRSVPGSRELICFFDKTVLYSPPTGRGGKRLGIFPPAFLLGRRGRLNSLASYLSGLGGNIGCFRGYLGGPRSYLGGS